MQSLYQSLKRRIVMPVFSQKKIEVKKPGRRGRAKAVIPQEVIDEYKSYIGQLEKGSLGVLEFKKNENINQARKALLQAGVELKKYVRVRKPRGSANTLQFEKISAKQWGAAKKAAKARGKKLAGKPKAKAKAKRKKG
jgi:hypothetical protein